MTGASGGDVAPSIRDALLADHRQLQLSRARYDDRYDAEAMPSTARGVLRDLITHVGFQQLAVFRVASTLHRRGHQLPAMMISRLIRHFYGAEMHWGASIEPGILLVHGNGLVISRSAHVSAGCVLSQNVTLGIAGGGAETGGAPRLLENVHVGPGAVLLGPIIVGPDSKIAANVVVSESVAERVIVKPAAISTSPRATRNGGGVPPSRGCR